MLAAKFCLLWAGRGGVNGLSGRIQPVKGHLGAAAVVISPKAHVALIWGWLGLGLHSY